jgi:hypothetical protein
VSKETVWEVGLVLVVVALLRWALLDQLKSRSGGRKLLWLEWDRGNRDIFWPCSARKNGYSNRFPGRNWGI